MHVRGTEAYVQLPLKCSGQSLKQRESRHGAASFETGDGRLLQPGSLGKLDLGQPELLTTVPHIFGQPELEAGSLVCAHSSGSAEYLGSLLRP
jgi:hypothetical protein